VRPTYDEQQTINDKLERKAQYNRQYRARRKALLATSSANYDNTTCDLAQPTSSTVMISPLPTRRNGLLGADLTCET